jgi:uncharacterized protein YbjT (DUF2867 family)
MQDKLVVVIGGSGFIGTQIVKGLVSQGAKVIVGCRDIEKTKFLQSIKGLEQVVLSRINVANIEDLKKVLEGADAVVSLVGILHETSTNTFALAQADAPGFIGMEAKTAGVKNIIHFSAIGADKKSLSKYAKSKALGEEFILSEFPETTIFRPSIVFGPDDSFFNRFAKLAIFSPILPLIGGGKTLFQPVYVNDIVKAVLNLLNNSNGDGKTYELGGPSIYSFRELLELMMLYTQKPRLLLNLPFWAARAQARFMEILPNPILTRDQVELLRVDNIVSDDALQLIDLGVSSTSCEAILPTYLNKYTFNKFM